MTPSTVAGLCDVAFTSACQNGVPWDLGRVHPLFFEGWFMMFMKKGVPSWRNFQETSKCCEMGKSKIWVCLKIRYTHKYKIYIYISKDDQLIGKIMV
jgi:hypothetical protein